MSRARRRIAVATLVAAYIAGSAVSGAIRLNPTDLDAFFLPAARVALSGDPLNVYSVRHDRTYPDANGPVALLPLTAVAAVADRLGRADDLQLRRVLVMAIFSIFPLLLSREAVLAIDRIRRRRVTGRTRPILQGLFAASPLIWQSVLLYGHVEQPLCLWLILFGVRASFEGRSRRAGFLFGMAILCRSSAALLVLPLLLRQVVRRPRGPGWSTPLLTLGTVVAALAPFLMAHAADTLYSLVTFRGSLPVGGGSIWYLAVGTPLEGWAQAGDGMAAVGGVVLSSAIVLWRRPPTGPPEAEVYGLLALAAVFFPMLAKTVWPYYLLEVYVLATIWALGCRPRRTLGGLSVAWMVPALICVLGLVAELGITSTLAPVWRRTESGGMFVGLATLAAVVLLALLRDYGNAVGRGVPEGDLVAGGAGTGGLAPAGGTGAAEVGTPAGGTAPAALGGAGVDVGPSGGVGQLARAALKGVEDGRGAGELPAGGVT